MYVSSDGKIVHSANTTGKASVFNSASWTLDATSCQVADSFCRKTCKVLSISFSLIRDYLVFLSLKPNQTKTTIFLLSTSCKFSMKSVLVEENYKLTGNSDLASAKYKHACVSLNINSKSHKSTLSNDQLKSVKSLISLSIGSGPRLSSGRN